ncbi:MAG: hypothetical protein FWB87_10910 [Defluviitaleaceae bacterium]|nr:hypothetical protein [Defluviitaleaceae bacterium]MCL2261964.1 hypothetical protein [Defluviitaleaceae bacterium]
MNAAHLLDRIFDVYKKSFWKQLAYAAIVGLIATTGMGFFMVGIGIFIAASMAFMGFGTAGVAIVAVSLLVIIPLVMLWQGTMSTGAILLSRQAFLGRKVKLPTYYIFRNIGRAVSALLAQFLVAIPYLAIVGGLLYFFFRFTAGYVALWLFNAYFVFSLVLLIAAVVGFFIYMHMFSLAVAVAVSEQVMFFYALRRSCELIKGDFWRLFGVKSMGWVIIFCLSFAASGVIMLIPALAGVIFAGNMLLMPVIMAINLIAGLLNIVVMFALGPLEGILTAVVYFNQRIEKEGFDIDLALDELTEAPPSVYYDI